MSLNYFYFFCRTSLGERLRHEDSSVRLLGSVGNRELTFSINKNRRYKEMEEKNKRHREERKRLVRPVSGIRFKRTSYSIGRGRRK